MTRPLASFSSRFTFRAVGIKRVTSPITCLICGLASIVARFFFFSSLVFSGSFMILGGALKMLGLTGKPTTPGGGTPGGTPGGAPGGRNILGGGKPVGRQTANLCRDFILLVTKCSMKYLTMWGCCQTKSFNINSQCICKIHVCM